jgi:hypothetical protein
MKKPETEATSIARWLRALARGALPWMPGKHKLSRPMRNRFIINTDGIAYAVTVTRVYKRKGRKGRKS